MLELFLIVLCFGGAGAYLIFRRREDRSSSGRSTRSDADKK